jgi:hypothetical protein
VNTVQCTSFCVACSFSVIIEFQLVCTFVGNGSCSSFYYFENTLVSMSENILHETCCSTHGCTSYGKCCGTAVVVMLVKGGNTVNIRPVVHYKQRMISIFYSRTKVQCLWYWYCAQCGRLSAVFGIEPSLYP